MEDLTRATGLQKGSLYSSFGNKEKLFQLALRKYIGEGPFKALNAKDALDALVKLYRKLILESQETHMGKRGCLVFNSGIEFGNQKSSLSQFVFGEFSRLESFFEVLVQRAHDERLIPKEMDIRKAAFRAFAAAFTIREMAKIKSDAELLLEIASTALASLGTNRRVAL